MLIPEGEARERGQLSFDTPDVAIVQLFYTIVTIRGANWFLGIKKISRTGMISYADEI